MARFLKYVWPFYNIIHELVNAFLTNVPILYTLGFLMFSGDIEWNIGWKWNK